MHASRITPHLIHRHRRVFRRIALLDPGVLRIVRVGEGLGAAGEHVEVVRRVAGRADDGMIPLRHEHHVVVTRHEQGVDGIARPVQRRGRIGVDPLVGVALGPVDLVIIDLFQIRLDDTPCGIDFMHVVFMRRITRPAAARRIDLDDNQAMTIEAGGHDVVDLARDVVAAANLDVDLGGRDQAGGVIFVGRDPGHAHFAIGLSRHRKSRPAGQVEGVGKTVEDAGARASVFDGLPHALYLPRRTAFSVTAQTDCEVGVAWVPTDEDHPARLITPAEVHVEIRGGDNVTRQINDIVPPGFDCHRLVVVEVYTPSGGWSSYPPHKHDVHKVDAAGRVIEADLEEIYYYKIDRPEGYAYQRIYTDPASPLHRAGYPIDALLMARDDDVVLVPEGYHPVVSAPGYTTYYLNVLAGSAQSLANSDDPQYTWVKQSYSSKNPAMPVYEVGRDA